MADIELVIKIPEETYEYWKNHSYEYVFAEAIKNGIRLPKGHGRLIDADELFDKIQFADFSSSNDVNTALFSICEATPIIEADKEQ